MKFSRGLLLLSFLLVFTAGAMAQDSLLGKGKGGGGGSGSGGGSPSGNSGSHQSTSRHDRNSGGGSSSDDGSDQSSGRPQKAQDDNVRQGDSILRKQPSRSGRVNYGTVHNQWKNSNLPKPVNINNAPSPKDLDDQRASMKDQIRREDRSHVKDRNHDRNRDDDRDDHDRDRDNHDRDDWRGWRIGYYHYNRNFRDDFFCYPYYVFDPYTADDCVVSPWYYYSFLPAYMDTNRLVMSSYDYSVGIYGDSYDYFPSRYRGQDIDPYSRDRFSDRRPLDIALDDLTDAFEKQDRHALDRLVPARGNVSLGVDNLPTYGVRADDFYDMMVDVISNSRTINYDILSVTTQGEEAEVIAQHDFLDSWGYRQSVYHKYHLFREHGQIVIRYFETNRNMIY